MFDTVNVNMQMLSLYTGLGLKALCPKVCTKYHSLAADQKKKKKTLFIHISCVDKDCELDDLFGC